MKKILTYNNGLKKRLGLVVLLMMSMLPALVWGEPVGQEAARQKAAAFLSGRAQARGTRATADQQLSMAYTSDEYHVFNRGEHDGFVIVSGDDCAPDILGYSDSGRFDSEHMPDNLQAWMNGYAEQIRMLRTSGVKYTARAKTRAGNDKKAIAPLLTSNWDQDDPYNLQTPIKDGKHCVTGCVATAMAQIMFYWYKKKGFEAKLQQDIPAYESDRLGKTVEGLSAPATFEWAKMTDSYGTYSTDASKQAVAKLMKYCGYSVEMNYGTSSGAFSKLVSSALKNLFGYEAALHLKRIWYKYEDWKDLIYSELAAERPVYYYGNSSGGGHAFVCDGYDKEDFFHINWGWSGLSDGYFSLNVLDPSEQGIGGSRGGFIKAQGIMICHPTDDFSLSQMPNINFFSGGEVEDNVECLKMELPEKIYRNHSQDLKITLKNTSSTGDYLGYFQITMNNGSYFSISVFSDFIEAGETKELNFSFTPTVVGDLYFYLLCGNKPLDEIHARVKDPESLGGRIDIVRNGNTLTFGANIVAYNPVVPGTYYLDPDKVFIDVNPDLLYVKWLVKNEQGKWDLLSEKTKLSETKLYTIKSKDVGKTIRVEVSSNFYYGSVYSSDYEIKKLSSNEMVVPPTLGVNDNSQVYVNYAVPSQEYIILSYKKDVANLTASDWAKAVSPTSSGRFVMGGTKGCTNYVYTRKKETDFTLPGDNVASDQIYLGDPTTVLQGIRMNVALMEKEGNETFFSPIDKEDLGAYYVKYGDVLRIKVSPLPETATFNGINASRWITKIVNGYPCGGFFANYQCTQELEEGQSYKEVYYKAWKHMNYNEVIAEITSGGPNSVYIDKFYLHVANEDGVIIMDSYQTEDVTIGVGEKRTGIQVNTRPLKATLSSAYAFVSNSISSEGKEPKVTFDNETRTMTVDATEADPGTYYYNVYQCGNTMSNKIRVDVTTPPIESVQILGDDNILAERGATIQMDMLVTPVNAVAGVVIWSVDDESIATITNEGVLTIKDDAPRGVPTKVTVLVDAIYMDECEVMVPLLTPTLWYDEANFEAFVGKPFTAPTLNNPQGLTITYSSSDEAVAKVDKTTGAVTPVGAGQAFIYADFKGNADYEPGDACYLITVYTKGDTNGDWTVDDDDITAISDYIKTGEAAGINLDAADMNGDNKVDATDLVLLIKEIK